MRTTVILLSLLLASCGSFKRKNHEAEQSRLEALKWNQESIKRAEAAQWEQKVAQLKPKMRPLQVVAILGNPAATEYQSYDDRGVYIHIYDRAPRPIILIYNGEKEELAAWSTLRGELGLRDSESDARTQEYIRNAKLESERDSQKFELIRTTLSGSKPTSVKTGLQSSR